jgi:hypothetical protein
MAKKKQTEPQLNPKEFAKEGGETCPWCKKKLKIQADKLEAISGGGAYRDCKCLACGATWSDTLVVTGYAHLWSPDGKSFHS